MWDGGLGRGPVSTGSVLSGSRAALAGVPAGVYMYGGLGRGPVSGSVGAAGGRGGLLVSARPAPPPPEGLENKSRAKTNVM